jgi:type IV pilus assembly protein PilA
MEGVTMSANWKYTRLIKNHAFTLIELMVVTAIIAVLLSIAIPNFIAYRHKGFCTQAESDADHIAGAISDYFSVANRTKLPNFHDLKTDTSNPDVKIIGDEPNVHITIQVTDRTHRCPIDYQSRHPGWDSNYKFVKEIR